MKNNENKSTDVKLSDIIKDVSSTLTDGQKEKAEACKTVDEFIEFAGDEGIELPAEILDNISGGGCRYQGKDFIVKCRRCDTGKPYSQLQYGYCKDCIKEMADAGVLPLL